MTRLIIVCIGFIIISLMFIGISYAEIDLESIVGFWHFDEGKGDVAEDSSGKGNDGQLHGPVWADGILGNCLQFDGVDDYVDCGNDESLNPPHITMAMWVWFDHIPYVHDIALNKEGKYRLIGRKDRQSARRFPVPLEDLLSEEMIPQIVHGTFITPSFAL